MPTPPAAITYLTPAEVAEQLRISPITVVRLCRDSKIPAVKVGGTWRIPAEDLAAALDVKKAS